MQKFLRLSLIVAITLSCSWHARDAHPAGSTAKLPLEIMGISIKRTNACGSLGGEKLEIRNKLEDQISK